MFSSSWEPLGALLSVDCCLSVCLPVRPSAVRPVVCLSNTRMVLRRGHSPRLIHWFTWKVYFARHRWIVFFPSKEFYLYVFGIGVLSTCVLIYEFFVYTAKQSQSIQGVNLIFQKWSKIIFITLKIKEIQRQLFKVCAALWSVKFQAKKHWSTETAA